jgi:SAM-dependent methyltransferase
MTIWDKRYAVDHYVYGTEPNEFLRHQIKYLTGSRVLCLGDGEGRNSVWLAEQGFEVTAVDISSVGLAKGAALARDQDVDVAFVEADIASYDLGRRAWDAVVSIFVPTAPSLRMVLHAKIADALVAGGIYVVETYHPDQAERNTGGGSDPTTMMTAEDLKRDFPDLEFLHLIETVRDVREGTFHTGLGSVVQAVIRRCPSSVR